MNKLLFSVALLILPCFTTAASQDECKVEGYVVGFFNGVANTESQAQDGLFELKSTIGINSYNGEDVEYQLFYNDSRIDEGAIYVLGDLAETFDQRTNELGDIAGDRWEAFWDIVNGRSNSSTIQRIISIIPSFADFVLSVVNSTMNELITALLESLASLSGGSANTAEVRTTHNLINDSQTWLGKKLIYVAHSQGNLWVNESYNYVNTQEGYDNGSLAVVHIAPASPTLNGDYVLSSSDIVINGLQFTGPGSVAPPNSLVPLSSGDPSGHMLVESYLTDSGTRSMIRNQINAAFARVAKPELEDHLYKITYQYSQNFLQQHKTPEYDFVDNKKDRDYCDEWVNGYSCFEYITSGGGTGYNNKLDPSSSVKPLMFKNKKTATKHDVTIETCKDIDEVSSFLFGDFANPKQLKGPLDITKSIKVVDRFDDTWLEFDEDISPTIADSLISCAGFGNFIELIASQEHYSQDEKNALKRLNLTGNYVLAAETFDSVCLLH
ncbi:hypothetical protein L4D15_19420 [Enterovibrio norvegicus]|uniref:hypothetical protein n=1 Tax=Enterovibrio norvegicus TaxID=188144 RepID=UPI003D114D11